MSIHVLLRFMPLPFRCIQFCVCVEQLACPYSSLNQILELFFKPLACLAERTNLLGDIYLR